MTTLPFVFGSPTSKTAAEVATDAAPTKRETLYLLIRAASHYGMTDEEAEHKLGWSGNTVRPRRVELVKAHRVIDSGKFRPTKSGRTAVVWIDSGAA